MHQFYWASVADFVEHISHLPLGLVRLLQSVKQLSFFYLELFSVFFSLTSHLFFVLHSHFVSAFQVLLIKNVHSVEVGLGTHLIVLYFLELLLPVAKEVHIVA